MAESDSAKTTITLGRCLSALIEAKEERYACAVPVGLPKRSRKNPEIACRLLERILSGSVICQRESVQVSSPTRANIAILAMR